MFTVDTNILLYAANESAPEHRRARSHLEKWRMGTTPWVVTWGILYEFLRVATHRKVFPRPLSLSQALAFVMALFQSGSFGVLTETDRHHAILADVAAGHPGASGNFLHDLHIAALLREHGVYEIRTTDTDFHRFRFLKVVNPLADSGQVK